MKHRKHNPIGGQVAAIVGTGAVVGIVAAVVVAKLSANRARDMLMAIGVANASPTKTTIVWITDGKSKPLPLTASSDAGAAALAQVINASKSALNPASLGLTATTAPVGILPPGVGP